MDKSGVLAERVALFRAHYDALRSAVRLRRLGWSVACLPVTEIAPLPISPSSARYDAVVATSAKAFLADPPIEVSSSLYVVGAGAARAAELRGWRVAAPPEPDAGRLIERLRCTLSPGAKTLYLAGRNRKPALEAALGEFCALEVVEAYAAEARAEWRPAEAKALSECAVALHYSRRSSALATQLAERAGASPHFVGMRHACLSDDVAEPLRTIGAARIVVAETPDEAALFATIGEPQPVFHSQKASRI